MGQILSFSYLMDITWDYFTSFFILYPLINSSNLFKKRDTGDRDYCVYIWMYRRIVYYIGEGRENRCITHKNDLLERVIGPGWICVMFAVGLTKMEGCILEAWLLSIITNRAFTQRGQTVWDGKSLINKQREYTYKGVKFEQLFKEYLNLDNGNNDWETFRRQINYY